MSVTRERLNPDEECEAKLKALRKTVNDSIAEGGEGTEQDLEALLAEKRAELRKAGF